MLFSINMKNQESLLDFRVKEKIQIIHIWLNVAEKLLSSEYKEEDDFKNHNNETVYLIKQNNYWKMYIIDKNFPNHRKIVIISFPFYIYSELGCVNLSWKGRGIKAREISMFRSVLEYMFRDLKPLPLYDAIISVISEMELEDTDALFLNDIIIELLSFNEGYIRYDNDPENEKGSIHPTYHLDIFFSNESAFKVGLSKKHSAGDLFDLLDRNKPCKFLK